MICVSLSEPDLHACLAALADIPFAEIRMDKMRLSESDVQKLFSSHTRLIATYRPGTAWDRERKKLLLTAIEAGAAYVDVEVEAEVSYREEIVAKARGFGCRLIVSYHDHQKTPAREELEECLSRCFSAGADIAKIACMTRSRNDNARLLGLLDNERQIVVVGMGTIGRITRVMAPMLGSPFTFASYAKGKETAEGQIDMTKLERLIRMIQKETDEGGEEKR
jgi:3-dehydroquinate dehydratase-1